jgi:lipid-binding SYLF domain-containing protein
MNLKKLSVMALVACLSLTGCQMFGGHSPYTNKAHIDSDVDKALGKLYATNPEAKKLAKNAKGILVFPSVVKAGFIGGAQFGVGALRKHGRTVGYYNLAAGSYGLQAGAQSFDYVMFFMKSSALDYLDSSAGLEVGVGPSIVVVDAGLAKNLTTTTAKEDVYAFITDQKGLMGGLGIQGSKITKYNPDN